MTHFEKVKQYLQELGYDIAREDVIDQIYVINAPEDGIQNMIVDCNDPILVIEQYLFDIDSSDAQVLRALLQKNREIIHGAFVLDETGKRLLFRDTLQLENLDLNEVEASINSLKLLMAEYAGEMLQFAK
ncbi:YbjN domain-containing protein [Rhodoflexus caldus]|uniref:YbjN domain-containing protein n=1 Tax=Rhodoflexus caldus TaxID=2891236 RepID=UPI00202A6550|nr:YbjN domain-containing protein [Rhodoflexus caldus]